MEQLTSDQLAERLAKEPLLFAQIATFNSPSEVSVRLNEIGVEHDGGDGADVLETVLDLAPNLSPKQLIYLYDFPFQYKEGVIDPNEVGIYESVKIAADSQNIAADEVTWSNLFRNSAAGIGEASQKVSEEADTSAPINYSPFVYSRCQICALRRLRNIVYVLLAVMLIMVLIKKW